MSFKNSAALFALATAITTPAAAWAFTGPGGCSSLPEYYRALGALQGNMENACNMTVEQARAIVASYGGSPVVRQPVTQAPRVSYRRHHAQRPN